MTKPTQLQTDARHRLAAVLRKGSDELLARWKQRTLSDAMVPEANRLREPELADTIPSLIRELATALTEAPSREDGEERGRELGSNAQSHAHARQRIAEG